jgi:hypothetical protein
VRFAIQHAVALQDRGAADRLREMALARAGRAEEEHVLVFGDEVACGELVDELAIHLAIEIHVEAVERFGRVAELRLFDPAFEESIASTLKLVGDDERKEIERRHRLGLRFDQARFQRISDTTQS